MHLDLLIAFFSYFLVLLIIGILAHRKQKTSKEFIMGSRNLNYWVTAFSAHASDMSSWLFMAFPAALFTGGLPGIWIGFGLLTGMFLNWQLISKRLRVETEKYNSYTISTFFENRFDDKSGTIRILTALIAIFFLTCYLAAGLIAMGYLLEALFGINYYAGLTIAMVVATTYTFIGGYYTVAKMDQFQAVFLMIVVAVVPIVGIFFLPEGISSVTSAAAALNIPMRLVPDSSLLTLVTIISLSFGWGLGYFGQPHVITKFMGIKCPDELRKSKYVGMTWQLITLTAAASIGLIGIGLFEGQLQNPELVFVESVKTLFPNFITGFILCGVIAANMSTMDSQILVCASILSEDFYKHFVRKKATEEDLLFVSRAGLLAIALLSLGIAFMRSSSVLDAVFYAWAGLGSSFGPLILMALYYKPTNKYGAIAGITVGALTAALWPSLNPLVSSLEIPSMLPGFTLSLTATFIGTHLFRKRQIQA